MADEERVAAEIRICWEYWQLDARLQRLNRYIRDVNVGDADGPDCPMWLLERQRDAMRDYIGALETRAELMGVDLYSAEAMRYRRLVEVCPGAFARAEEMAEEE